MIDSRSLINLYEPDILHNYKQTKELTWLLNTFKSFEYIIDILNHYYFNKVDLQFQSATKYFENGKFNYEIFKADYIAEVEKLESIRPALEKTCKAIEVFYTEIKDYDIDNVIPCFFGEKQPKYCLSLVVSRH